MPISCDPNDLLTAAACIQSCLTEGQMEAIQTKLLCDIASVFTGGGGGGGTGPWVLKAGDTMTGALNINLGSTPSVTGGILHISTDTTATGLTVFEQASADTDDYDLSFRKARGTVASPSVVTVGDFLGNIMFRGYSGASGYVTAASIRAVSTGTIADTRVPSSLVFATGTNAAPTVLTDRWSITSSGHLTPSTDNTEDVGLSGTRPRNLFAGTSAIVAGAVYSGTDIIFINRSRIDGAINNRLVLYNNAANDFGLLQFGGITASFPALKRSTVTIQCRLADDSLFAAFSALDITANAGTAIPAGGTAGAGLKVSSTANFGVFFGSNVPSLSAAKGSLYLRSDGSGSTDRAYINTDGGTTWTAINTVA